MAKNLPAMQETWVQSLGLEDPLEKGMATHSSSPAWRIPWTEEPGRPWGAHSTVPRETLVSGQAGDALCGRHLLRFPETRE